ncbi:hypothetical protein BXZ70DRAFT_727352 [Cristinia sonorae]|uniref:Protein CPL1-like domain-containing protein n=1 Tax=Cristinia sonorae TaxID=1940300 RepID=A0A8K0UTX0_9AGAR|nr:hypothetical protein BXZ70DRAFT_727352 [Cristinia sonorae]
MKLLALTPLVLLAVSSASATSLTHGYDIVKSRQAKVHRDLLDVCVGLDADLTLADILRDGNPLVAGHLNVCLCVSAIPDFIKTNAAAKLAVNLLGVAKVTALIEALINNHPSCQHCSFPAHSHSMCAPSWPCQFECDHGYTPHTNPGDKHPSSCVCPAPKMECNGKCGDFPHGCGSAVPAPPPHRRSRLVGKRQFEEPTCEAGKEVCGVPGGTGWECVDTRTDKESCSSFRYHSAHFSLLIKLPTGGACTTPFPPDSFHTAIGQDCTSIDNVDVVDCRSSTCYVSSCKPGFEPSPSHDSCVPSSSTLDKRMFNLGPGVVAVGGHAKRSVVAGPKADIRNLVKLGEGAGLAAKVPRHEEHEHKEGCGCEDDDVDSDDSDSDDDGESDDSDSESEDEGDD